MSEFMFYSSILSSKTKCKELMEGSHKVVMLIDDDSEEHSLFKDALVRYNSNINCITALSCQQGYDKAKTSKPDIIFLDMNLPGTNGLACLRKFKKTEALKDVPVYIYSGGLVTQREVTIALQEGALKWLRKPEAFEGYDEIFSTVLN